MIYFIIVTTERRDGWREGGRAYLDRLDRPLEVSGNGFLAEDVLASRGTLLDLVSVELGGGANPDSLDVGVVDDLGREGGEGGRGGRG